MLFKSNWLLPAFMLGGLSSGMARADILVRNDGGLLDGKVVSQDAKEIVFQPDGAEAAAVQHLEKSAISRVVITGEHGELKSDSAAPATQPSTKWNVPAEPVAPPMVPAGKGATYLLIPLHGEVGDTVLASALEKSLEDAVKRKPTVVVLDINSPGGLVAEAKQIISILHHYNKKLRIVAWTNQDLSAAAIFSLSVKEIYVKPSSTIGAATSFIPNNLMLPPKIEEKMQSAWRAVARNSAEEGGHQTLLAEAMIDNDHELHLEKVDGKPVVKEGLGDEVLCRKGKILTLSSHEAVACGLAAGEAEDIAELGTQLKLGNWTEVKGLGTLLADSLPKRTEAFKTEQARVLARFQQDLSAAINADPSDSVVTRVTRVPQQPTRPMGPGSRIPTRPGTRQETITVTRHHPPARWKPDSLACVLAIQKLETDVQDAMSLSTAYGRMSEVEMLKDALDHIAGLRATVYDDRNKFGQGEIVAANAPPANGDAATSTRQPVVMPPGSRKTEMVGGKGGSAYLTVFRDSKPGIGFRYTLGSWNGKQVMKRIGPVNTPRGNATLANDVQEIVAKDGYVVGGMIVDADETNVVAFKVIFVAYADGKVNLKDTYQSDWQGTADTNAPRTLGGGGEVIRGMFGRRGLNQDALGLVVSPPGETAGAAPGVDQHKIPETPAAGMIHGRVFKADKAELAAGWLTLRQGPEFFPELSLRIYLAMAPGEKIDGKSLHLSPEDRDGPHIRLTWKVAGEKVPKDVFYESRTVDLEFGKVADGKVSGKIYVKVPDDEHSYIAGTFTADVK